MTAEALLAATFALIGYATLVSLGGTITRAMRIWLAYPMGAAVWIVASTTVLTIRVPFSPGPMLILLAAASVVALIVQRRRDKDVAPATVARELAISVILPGFIAAISAIVNLTVMTNDSFWILRQARTLLSAGGVWGPADYLVLRSFPIAVALLQAPAEILGREYIVSQPTVLSVTGIGGLTVLAAHAIREAIPGRPRNWTILIAGVLFLGTAFFVVFQVFYIRGNLEAGIYAALAVTSVWLAAAERRDVWALPAGLSIAITILFRVENPLFLVPFIAVAMATPAVPRRVRIAVLGAYGATVVGWYGAVMLLVGRGTIMDGKSISVILLTVPALVVVFILAGSSGRLGVWLREHAGPLIIGGLSLTAVLVTVWRPSWMAQAFLNVMRNTFEPAQGLWGVTWIILIPLFFFAIRYPRLPYARLFTVWIGSYLMLLYISAAFFTVPHKVGWTSSANRMLSVVLLTTWVFVLVHFSAVSARRTGAASGTGPGLTHDRRPGQGSGAPRTGGSVREVQGR